MALLPGVRPGCRGRPRGTPPRTCACWPNAWPWSSSRSPRPTTGSTRSSPNSAARIRRPLRRRRPAGAGPRAARRDHPAIHPRSRKDCRRPGFSPPLPRRGVRRPAPARLSGAALPVRDGGDHQAVRRLPDRDAPAQWGALRPAARPGMNGARTSSRACCGPPSHRRPGPIPGNHPNNTRRHDIDTSA